MPCEFEFDLVGIPYDRVTLRSRRVPLLGSRILGEPENAKKCNGDGDEMNHSGETADAFEGGMVQIYDITWRLIRDPAVLVGLPHGQ